MIFTSPNTKNIDSYLGTESRFTVDDLIEQCEEMIEACEENGEESSIRLALIAGKLLATIKKIVKKMAEDGTDWD